jgi:hypothetical protein
VRLGIWDVDAREKQYVGHEKESHEGDQYLSSHVTIRKDDVPHFSIHHVLV